MHHIKHCINIFIWLHSYLAFKFLLLLVIFSSKGQVFSLSAVNYGILVGQKQLQGNNIIIKTYTRYSRVDSIKQKKDPKIF